MTWAGTNFKSDQPSRLDAKLARRAKEAKEMRSCYVAVNARDDFHCRVCGSFCPPNAITLIDKAHHHHLQYRSLGGEHTTENVCTLCSRCHDAIHVKGTLRLGGNADERNEMGKLAGIEVQELTESGWKTVAWV